MYCDSDPDEYFEPTSPEVRDTANCTISEVIPQKSKIRYNQRFENFKDWCIKNNINTTTENVLLTYFVELSESYKHSTLWSVYSMLKTTLILNENVDISKFQKLKAFIKSKAENYKPKKSEVLSQNDIDKFLAEAPDETYLLMKVALVIGVGGACRVCELVNLKTTDITLTPQQLIININTTSNQTDRTFIVTNTSSNANVLPLLNKYISLRPRGMEHSRFFINYKNFRCTEQPVGVNAICKFPSIIASYLQKPNPKMYTGHCFRRTSSSLSTNTGGDLLMLKNHKGWRSIIVPEGYADRSIENKTNIADIILQDQMTLTALNQPLPSTSAHSTHLTSDSFTIYNNNQNDSSDPNIKIERELGGDHSHFLQEYERLREENNMLKLKVELLFDMLTDEVVKNRMVTPRTMKIENLS